MIAKENSRNLNDTLILMNSSSPARVRGALRKIRSMRGRKTEKRIGANSNLQKKSFSLKDKLRHGNKKGVSLGRLGSLEARIASNKRQIKRAQSLRYFVFYEEMSAVADAKSARKKRDIDPYDKYCDHVLVVDHGTKEKRLGRTRPKLVGTYRLLRQEIAENRSGFYTQGEFDVKSLIQNHSEAYFLELGRSCVLKDYRGKHTIELLWSAIWRYVLEYKIDVMFGCASFQRRILMK